jgi:RNA polymerase sigma factor (sigma-70 family)
MFGKAISYEALWGFVGAESVAADQQWILSAMQKYGPDLVNMLWRILSNEQDVCDCYQDTFLQLAHNQGGCRPRNIKAYIFRTANNIAVSMLRRRIARRNNLPGPQTAKNALDSPVKELDSRYLQETLRRFITKLPEHLRNVIILRDLAELSYGETGRILDISAATARVYRCKAIQLLSVWMGKEE